MKQRPSYPAVIDRRYSKAPQVGLEPTTLRLTSKSKPCISLVLRAFWLGWNIVLHGIRREIVQKLFSRSGDLYIHAAFTFLTHCFDSGLEAPHLANRLIAEQQSRTNPSFHSKFQEPVDYEQAGFFKIR
jgi:hypothetical protein